MTAPRRLIEVALPLAALNREAAREKSIRHGHPSTLHLWWSRKPLAACRIVLLASLLPDPADPQAPAAYLTALDALPRPAALPRDWEQRDQAARRRERLLAFLARLAAWESTTDAALLAHARQLVALACEGEPPPVLDPFCGGGSIPLEAQRLGLAAHASDLNPVAVLITRALVTIPALFAGRPPVHPDAQARLGEAALRGAAGLAADVRAYGRWLRDEAARRIGHLYPAVRGEGTDALLTPIAWLWARTARCPNPACGAQMPLVSKWRLSDKPGRKVWVEPLVDRTTTPPTIRFTVKSGSGRPPEGTVNRRGATCIACGTAVPFPHIRAEGKAGRMSARLMAIVAEGVRGRVYLPPDDEHERIAASARPAWAPEAWLPQNPRDFKTPNYGMPTFADLFTARQLVALTTFTDLIAEARERVRADAVAAGLPNDDVPLAAGGTGARAYADAVAVYLALALDRLADYGSAICLWHAGRETICHTYARQALPMVWDFAEANPLGEASGGFLTALDYSANALTTVPATVFGTVSCASATDLAPLEPRPVVSTDPPYYDNISYADLSDFFYVWLRRALADVYPDLFRTVLTPKTDELVATPYRVTGGKEEAERLFREGLGQAFRRMRAAAHPAYPVTIFYAYRQREDADADDERAAPTTSNGGGEVRTGWEAMLTALLEAGFQITASWPMRTELNNRIIARAANALATSVVLACRPRPEDAPVATLAEFRAALARELPPALATLLAGDHVRAVDLQQAAIGPGMAVFSRYARVIAADGHAVTVREALNLISDAIATYRYERASAFDGPTRFCLDWYQQYGWAPGQFGDAETLARGYNVVPDRLATEKLLEAKQGKVRLLKADSDWSGLDGLAQQPFGGSVWEACLRLALTLRERGEAETAMLAQALGAEVAGRARELAVWLYTLAEQKQRSEDALLFNSLDASWPEIQRRLQQATEGTQGQLLDT